MRQHRITNNQNGGLPGSLGGLSRPPPERLRLVLVKEMTGKRPDCWDVSPTLRTTKGARIVARIVSTGLLVPKLITLQAPARSNVQKSNERKLVL